MSISLYISLELASLSLYALVGFLKDEKSTESSLKYLLLGAVASAVLLFGMALVFGFTGKTSLSEIAGAIGAISSSGVLDNPGLLLGIVLFITTVAVRVGFHALTGFTWDDAYITFRYAENTLQ